MKAGLGSSAALQRRSQSLLLLLVLLLAPIFKTICETSEALGNRREKHLAHAAITRTQNNPPARLAHFVPATR